MRELVVDFGLREADTGENALWNINDGADGDIDALVCFIALHILEVLGVFVGVASEEFLRHVVTGRQAPDRLLVR